ncbi:Transcription factor HES-1-B, partial [Leptosomus discolor]
LTAVRLSPPTAALSTDPTVLGKYRAGFSECMNEVTRFLSTCEGVNTEVRTRLLGHLASCMTQINAMNYPAPPPPPPPKVYGGFQLLPASDGQFAFLIPSTAFAPGGAVLPLYGGPPTAATAASPPGPPPGTADSVWRPW